MVPTQWSAYSWRRPLGDDAHIDEIEKADLVLTTYETLRDYQLSFAKVRFAVVVYDEAQKLKNPASLMNRSAKGQQGGFTLLMTGTPIENSEADLWTLLDIAWPGFLGFSLKEFLKGYRGADGKRREELRRRLVNPTSSADGVTVPPVMLRRFKKDILEGLPRKDEAVSRDHMPAEQQAAYDAIRQASRKQPGGTLAALQGLRTVSLHPRLGQKPPSTLREDEDYIAASARFQRLFKILDDIHEQHEKALIFVDLREAQMALHGMIRWRFKLPEPLPQIINGATSAPQRDAIRKAFQEKRKGLFDCLLLGPKAAGFGLTLTAANHVIHVNRWWNPAVEDQCSDRVYRIGQDKPVTIHLPLAIHPDLGAEGSFDGILHSLLEDKRALSSEVVVPVQFSDIDMRALFERSFASKEHPPETSAHVDGMDWRTFELWVADRLREAGLSVDVTSGTGDGGVDIIAHLAQGGGRTIFVQCKHSGRGSERMIGEQAIHDLLRARTAHSALVNPRLVAVTNAHFTLAAERLAQEHNVRLLDATSLPSLGEALSQLT